MFCVDNLTTYESQDVNNYSCSLQRKKGGGASLLFSTTAPLLSFLLNSPFPPPFIQEGFFP